MTGFTFLKISGEEIPVKRDDYSLEYADVEASSTGKTEAGTNHVDLIREGVPEVAVTLTVTRKWLQKLRTFKRAGVLDCEYYDAGTGSLIPWKARMADFSVKVDDSSKADGAVWDVSFRLEDMETDV